MSRSGLTCSRCKPPRHGRDRQQGSSANCGILPTEWRLDVEDAGNRRRGRVRHYVRNAFEHLRKACRLHGVDDEMSAFGATTADDEGAAALMPTLKARRYPGADRLRMGNHLDKDAFYACPPDYPL